jgi:uncharacterized protein YdeI (YjbR/CyaY-like superfamily)
LGEKQEAVVSKQEVATGVVHDVPTDLRKRLTGDTAVLALWNDITALARNEWLCWIEDAKRPETRRKRISRVGEDLRNGKRRPCCWPGCAHREKNGTAPNRVPEPLK